MRTLITGGFGFVGQALARRLAGAGHDVVRLARSADGCGPGPAASVAVADLRDGAAIGRVIAEGGFDGVVHLAALTRVRDSISDPVGYFETNLTGTTHLLAALDTQARRTGLPARLVFASTGAVYGTREGRLDESEPARPAHPYASAKHAAEQLIGYQAATGRLRAITLRCFNVAGALPGLPDRDLTRLIPKALAVAAGAVDRLPVNGDGSARREYTHVADVAEAYALALAAVSGAPGERSSAPEERSGAPAEQTGAPAAHQVLNVGSGSGVSVREVVDAVERITGRVVPVEWRPAAAESQVLMADSSRIRARLGWLPRYSDLDRLIADGWAQHVPPGSPRHPASSS